MCATTGCGYSWVRLQLDAAQHRIILSSKRIISSVLLYCDQLECEELQRRVCPPPASGAGGGHTRWVERGGEGSIFWKTPGTALYSTYVSTLCSQLTRREKGTVYSLESTVSLR